MSEARMSGGATRPAGARTVTAEIACAGQPGRPRW